MTLPTLTIGIIAAEASGDALGKDLMHKLNCLHPNIQWVGIGGDGMMAQGLQNILNMERLSVMGLTEVLKHLPDLVRAKHEILTAFHQHKIDMFIGIDAPDFNLSVGKSLKDRHIFRVQYVSPSVWAWRENRIHNIKQSCDLVLCLFPFELDVYQKHQHPAVCVGHPLLDKLHSDPRHLTHLRQDFCQRWQNFHDLHNLESTVISVMAGSRTSEIQAIMPTLIDSMAMIAPKLDHQVSFILPVISQNHADLVRTLIKTNQPKILSHVHIIHPDDAHIHHPNNPMSISQQAMNISDAIILASGTATLEALLLNRPMVVVYKLSQLSYAIAKRLVKIPYVSLPNILAHNQNKAACVPELIQQQATPQNITQAALQLLHDSQQQRQLQEIVHTLRQQSHHCPAVTVLEHFKRYPHQSVCTKPKISCQKEMA